MNDLVKMAIRKLKRIKMHAMLLFGSLLILSTILITVLNIISMNNHEEYIHNLEKQGSYYYYIWNDEPELKDELTNSPIIEALDFQETYTFFSCGRLGYLEGGELLPFHMIEGKYPTKSNEIALPVKTIEQLQCERKLGSKIEIEWDNGEIKEYYLSGIIQDNDNLPLQAYTTKQKDGYDRIYYFNTYNHAFYRSSIEDVLTLENPVYRDYKETIVKSNLEMMSYSLIVSLLILSGLSMLHEDNVDDIVLYRGMGGTKSSVILYVFIQSFTICSLAVLIANILAVVFSVIYGFIQSVDIYLNLEMMLEIVMINIYAMIIGTIIPAIRLSNIDLTGGLKKKHRRVLFPKKRGKITNFTLARRFVLDHFSRYFFMMALVIVALLIIHTNLTSFIGENDGKNELKIEYTYSYDKIKTYLNREPLIKNYRCYTLVNNVPATYEETFGNNNPYQKVEWYGAEEAGFIEYRDEVQIANADHLSDASDYVEGKGVIVYAPKVLLDKEYGYLYRKEYISDQFEIVQNTSVKIGDQVKINDVYYPIIDIITDLGDVTTDILPNCIFVSSSFPMPEISSFGVSKFYIELSDNTMHSKVKQMILNVSADDPITQVTDPFEFSRFDVSSLIRFIAAIIIVVTMIIELVFTKQNERKERIAMLRSLGMTKENVTIIFVLESVIIYFITTIAMILCITVQNYMAYELNPVKDLLGSVTFAKLFSQSEIKSMISIMVIYLIMLVGSSFIMMKMNYRKDYMSQIKNRE